MAILDVFPDGDGALSDLVGGAKTPEEAKALRDSGQLIDLDEDERIVVAGIEGGMTSGKPAVALAFKLPDGRVVIAQTSWRLFATAAKALGAKFGPPDTEGMAIVHPGTATRNVIVGDDDPRYMECVVCHVREEFEPQSAPRSQPMEPLWWLNEHMRTQHPDVAATPDVTAGVARCKPGEHDLKPVPADAPFGEDATEMCFKCGEVVFDG